MILSNSWAMEEFASNHDELLNDIFANAVKEANPYIPEKYEPEDIPDINKKLEEVYLTYFKNSVVNQLEKYFLNYDYDVKEGLQKLIEEIKQEKISFKNLKSKIMYYIENDENYKKEDDGENKFSLEAQVTVEDL